MVCWTVYAILNGNTVAEVIVGEPLDCVKYAKSLYGENGTAVSVSMPDIPVKEGDKYIDGKFYRMGEEIKPLPTEQEEITELKRSTRIKLATHSLLLDSILGVDADD